MLDPSSLAAKGPDQKHAFGERLRFLNMLPQLAECLVRLVMPTIGTLAAAGMELSRLSMVAKATNLSEMHLEDDQF